MTRKDLHKRFSKDQSGAVAATYAIALVGLIVIMGVGFDYSRVMGMDSELQNGADQAAIAGATQLDKNAGACSRASAAIVGLLSNSSILTSDTKAVTIPSEPACDATGFIRFYQDRAKTTASDDDSNANYVEVTVNVRTVDYAFLPLTGLFTSTEMTGVAMAGLGSAICKVPPVMLCNPRESTDPDFDVNDYIGKGIRLVANDGGGYVPGNFGYLETDAGSGAIATARVLGREEFPGDCVATDGVTTKPGVQISVLDALNTRFGIYTNGLNNVCNNDGSLCPPSANSRIDLVKGPGNSCGITGNGFQVGPAPYRPTSAVTPLTQAEATALDPMGYPRDMCHAVSNNGVCGVDPTTDGRIGTGVWDKAAYFRTHTTNYPSGLEPGETWSNYGPTPGDGTVTVPTRYQLYKYEAQSATPRLQTTTVGSNLRAQGAPLCNSASAVPVTPAGTGPDRRVLSVAVINCSAEGVIGKSTDVNVQTWIDVFLVEPAFARGNGPSKVSEASDVYIEVIRESTLGGDATQGQEIRKDVPYLVE